jgi:hypothetical protein
MRRLILCLLFLACDVRAAAPVIVTGQHASGSSSTNSINVSFASNVTAGNMILVCIAAPQNDIITAPTMTGETFTVWTGSPEPGTAGNGQTSCWATNSATGGQKQVTEGTTTGSAGIHMHIFEISGAAASPRDAQGHTQSTTMSVSTSGATTTANDLVIAFFYDFANNRTLTQGAGYAQIEQVNDVTNGDVSLSEQKTVSSTGTQTATATGNSTDTVEQSIVAVAGTATATPGGAFIGGKATVGGKVTIGQ